MLAAGHPVASFGYFAPELQDEGYSLIYLRLVHWAHSQRLGVSRIYNQYRAQ